MFKKMLYTAIFMINICEISSGMLEEQSKYSGAESYVLSPTTRQLVEKDKSQSIFAELNIEELQKSCFREEEIEALQHDATELSREGRINAAVEKLEEAFCGHNLIYEKLKVFLAKLSQSSPKSMDKEIVIESSALVGVYQGNRTCAKSLALDLRSHSEASQAYLPIYLFWNHVAKILHLPMGR
ncbi:MAG: hypothetical protein FWC41_03765 [Firmicutes bacterium]|nr:hypothetical protein [Bacillota bacterium]